MLETIGGLLIQQVVGMVAAPETAQALGSGLPAQAMGLVVSLYVGLRAATYTLEALRGAVASLGWLKRLIPGTRDDDAIDGALRAIGWALAWAARLSSMLGSIASLDPHLKKKLAALQAK